MMTIGVWQDRIGQIMGVRQTNRQIFSKKSTWFLYTSVGMGKNRTTYGKTDVTEFRPLRWDRVLWRNHAFW
jgi:hypothetical protein